MAPFENLSKLVQDPRGMTYGKATALAGGAIAIAWYILHRRDTSVPPTHDIRADVGTTQQVDTNRYQQHRQPQPTTFIRRLARWWFKVWHSTQVELHGQYSIEHLHALHVYVNRTHWLHVALVCLLTPIPAIAFVILLDLIPLEPPENGPDAIGTWGRLICTAAIVSTSILYQFRSNAPWMQLTHSFMWTVGLLAAVLAILFLWQLARVVGFPIPFVLIAGAPSVTAVIVVAVTWTRRDQIRRRSNVSRDLLPYANVFVCQTFMTIIYPVYNHIFATLPSTQQTAFVLLQPIIKIACKFWIYRSIRDSRDASPEVIIFNVEVFHALYVANCMQSSTSMRTVLVLVLVDFIHACISWWDVRTLLAELKEKSAKLLASTGKASTIATSHIELLKVAVEIIEADPIAFPIGPRLQSHTPQTIVPEPNAVKPVGPKAPPSQLHRLDVDERHDFVDTVQRILYLTEFVVLIEYTEVIMPVIYCAYTAILSERPNHKYYQFLDGLASSSLVPMLTNISVYISTEFVSLVLMALVLWWQLRFSLVHQLAYNLESRQDHVHAKLVGWAVYIVHNALVQSGADFSFQFEWLRNKG
ncbi:hypothetical protein Poli38472_004757 [Pythium oligandrum]|uniref:Uncharacterized protein n=1 Tax=Pythium oligandrum TaxID=41045 RepID=A0A8K1CB10_PYTOL|nr:hypothetical protein Poli38472_004757 [Pythium oligandrum]|eukprot:TMW59688.1 hypothetical protein Poli38472_004757 [Pythium oligandrum]